MARRKIQDPEQAVTVESRNLITMYDGDSLAKPLDGALVRYYPDTGLSAVEVARRADQILQAGAAAVKVQARQRDEEAVTVTLLAEPTTSSTRARKNARDVVMQEATRMTNVDQQALTRVLDTVLSEVGL